VDGIGDVEGFVQGVDWVDGEDGAERFFDDHRIVHRVDEDGSGLDEQIRLVHLSTHDDLALGVVHHLLHPQEVSLVDNTRQIRARLGTVGEELLERGIEVFDEGRYD